MSTLDVALGTHLTVAATTLYGLVGTRVYMALAPIGAAKPYVIYSVSAGGYVNDTPTDRVEVVYNIQGIGATVSSAMAVDDAILARLHNVAIAVSSWSTMSCMREDDLQYDEIVNGAPVFHRGAYYRIRLTK